MKRLLNRSLTARTTPLENTTSTTATTEKSDPFDTGTSPLNTTPSFYTPSFQRDLPGIQAKLIDVYCSPSIPSVPSIPSDPKDSVAIILDWDDTLFPTTWMRRVQRSLYAKYRNINTKDPTLENGLSDLELWTMFDFRHLSSSDRILLRRLELSSIELLKECNQKSSKLYIITNAQLPWVQLSARTFMPKLLAAVIKYNVSIISARDTFLSYAVDETSEATPETWKLNAFQTLTASFLEQTFVSNIKAVSRCTDTTPPTKGTSELRNRSTPARRWWRRTWRGHSRSKSTASIATVALPDRERCIFVSIGDSECERAALLKCRDTYFQHAYFKSIKLVDAPHPLLLKRQQDYVRRTLEQVVSVPESVDIIFVPPTEQQQTVS